MVFNFQNPTLPLLRGGVAVRLVSRLGKDGPQMVRAVEFALLARKSGDGKAPDRRQSDRN